MLPVHLVRTPCQGCVEIPIVLSARGCSDLCSLKLVKLGSLYGGRGCLRGKNSLLLEGVKFEVFAKSIFLYQAAPVLPSYFEAVWWPPVCFGQIDNYLFPPWKSWLLFGPKWVIWGTEGSLLFLAGHGPSSLPVSLPPTRRHCRSLG